MIIMLTDALGNEFKYHDYITYLRDGEVVLARIDRIVISNTSRLICKTDQGGYYNRLCYVTLKKLDAVEIISEEDAKEKFTIVYNMLNPRW